jgi:hypothetical protein
MPHTKRIARKDICETLAIMAHLLEHRHVGNSLTPRTDCEFFLFLGVVNSNGRDPFIRPRDKKRKFVSGVNYFLFFVSKLQLSEDDPS